MDCGDDPYKVCLAAARSHQPGGCPVRPEKSDEQGVSPPSPTPRAPLSEVTASPTNVRMEVEESVEAEAKGSAKSSPMASPDAVRPPAVAEMQTRAVAKFCHSSKAMCDSDMGKVAYESSHVALAHAIQAINNIFDQRRVELCCSPERPDLTITKEEALGWLLADMFECELLVAEA
eukprot:824789-Prymnesium_polylepis.1